jgi:hypothetical protein
MKSRRHFSALVATGILPVESVGHAVPDSAAKMAAAP